MKVLTVDRESPLSGRIKPGFSVISVNGDPVLDEIDFHFKTTDSPLKISFSNDKGGEVTVEFSDHQIGNLGLTFEEPRIKTCKCNCIFCFVMQQPKGMRHSLYIKDEDYRYSFRYGSFVTLSNITEEDIKRIIDQRLSPIYISVHATDDKLRRCMLRNEKLAPIIPRLQRFIEGGIRIHSQVVLCPGVNDGEHLERTISGLVELHPGVESLAIVPVGLTKFREHLPNLRRYTRSEAAKIIDRVEIIQTELLKKIGTRFVWLADEFYITAARKFPGLTTYEEMPQFENGVGMSREFISRFNRRRRFIKGLNKKRSALLITGNSAKPMFVNEILPFINKELELNIDMLAVPNRFWGEDVTVSGLLTGQDILRYARPGSSKYDTVIIPPNCLNDDELFLDNLTKKQFEDIVKCRVVVGQYDMVETIKEVFAEGA